MITLIDVCERLEEIREIAADYEAAHDAEIQLRADVLEAIAKGHPESQALAALALMSSKIKFTRYTS